MADLFDYQPPVAPTAFARRDDPLTSHAAARSVEADVPALEMVVLKAVPFAPESAILDEVVEATNLDKVTASPRFKPLEEKGLIIRVGKRRGFAGRQQTAWARKPRYL